MSPDDPLPVFRFLRPSPVLPCPAQVLDIVIRHAFVVDPLCTVMGRGFYYSGDGVVPLSGGAEIWTGFQQVRGDEGCGRMRGAGG